jgi:hypothetical protein
MLVIAGLTAPAALSAADTKWTATGAVKALSAHSITVGHTTCRVTTASPGKSVLRRYYVGANAKIACVHGVLRTIAVAGKAASVTVTGGTACTASTLSSANTSVSLSHTNGCTFTSDTLTGRFTVLNFTGNSILAGAGSITLMCTIGSDAPDTRALSAGAPLTQLTCRNGLLTGFVEG